MYNATTNAVVIDIPGSPTSITGLAAGTYSYYVKAYDAAGNLSYKSNTVDPIVTG